MAYDIIDPILGSQPIADTSTTQKHPLGLTVRAKDDTAGAAEFMYVQASNSISQYDAVAIKAGYKIAPLTLTNAALAVEVGFSQIAIGAKLDYAWTMKGGRPIVKVAVGVQAGGVLYATATGGVLDDTSASVLVQGVVAVTEVTNSAGTTTCVARFPTLKRGAT